MTKYEKRVISEFEEILVQLSNNSTATYRDAYNASIKYAEAFAKRKGLDDDERQEVLELCLELTQDWFPDVSSQGRASYY